MGVTPVYASFMLDASWPISLLWDGRADMPAHDQQFLHAHDCWELGWCEQGSGSYVIEDTIQRFAADTCVCLPPHSLHIASSDPGTTSRWCFIALDPVTLLRDQLDDWSLIDPRRYAPAHFPSLFDAGRLPVYKSLFDTLTTLLRQTVPTPREAVRGVVRAMFAMLKQLADQHPPLTQQQGRTTDERFARILPALSFMSQHLGDHIRMQDLSALCQLSPAHFRRAFVAAVGCSPQAYLIERRLRRACSLLSEHDWSVLTVSLAAGFPTLSNFNRSFRERFGMSPREWRRNHG